VIVVIDELQLERRYSYGFLLKKAAHANVLLQRTRTDAAIKTLQDNYAERLGNFSEYTLLDQLQTTRNGIDNNTASAREVMSFYTSAVLRLGALTPVSSENISYLQPIVRNQAGQKLLNDMATYIGTMRIAIYHILVTDKLETDDIASLSRD